MTDTPALKIVQRKVSDLAPYVKNPRKNDAVVDQMVAAITEFGFVIPILARSDGEVIDGHLRLKAAIKLKMKTVPVTLADHMTPEQVKAFRLLANRSANWAEWDSDLLRTELLDLQGLGFDLALTGFDSDELLDWLGAPPDEPRDPDETPDIPDAPISRLGDVWCCGDHRVGCLDSTDIEAVRAFVGDVKIDFANCDPPYGIKIVRGTSDGGAAPFGSRKHHGTTATARASDDPKSLRGRVHGLGKAGAQGAGGKQKGTVIKTGVYQPVIGDTTTETAVHAYAIALALGVPVIVLWGGNYYANSLPPSSGWLVWDKENSGNFADAELAWTNYKGAVRLLRHQWNGLIKASERGQKRVHPTQKPVALAEWVHKTVAPKANTVLDLFSGSGCVLIGAERAGITCLAADLAEAYVDCTVVRWANLTEREPTLLETGETFAQVTARRIAEREAAA